MALQTSPQEGISPRRAALGVGIVCLLLVVSGWSLSLPLHCPMRAAIVGGFAYFDGSLLGLCLALVTRSHRPLSIYFWLLAAALTLWPAWHEWPIWRGWPVGDPAAIHAWSGAPSLVVNYFDLLRFCLFLLGIPYPFIRFGHHSADPIADPIKEVENATKKE